MERGACWKPKFFSNSEVSSMEFFGLMASKSILLEGIGLTEVEDFENFNIMLAKSAQLR